VPAPQGEDIPRFTTDAGALVSAGADLLAITGQETTSATRVSPVAAAAVLRERADADVIIDVEAGGRNLTGLQADLLGGYALGVRTVVCRTGTPWVPGDYPDPYSPGDVDSVRLVALLAGLNEGADWRGVKVPVRTRFVIGACLHTAAADTGHELARCREKAEAGAHFLLTDLIYDVDAALRLIRELRGHGVDLPVVAEFAPFGDARAITRLIHEVPGTVLPSPAVSVPGASQELSDPAMAVLEGIRRLRGLIVGTLIRSSCKPDDRMAGLVARLASMRQAS
jgi:homocysteine S-methyltransferase